MSAPKPVKFTQPVPGTCLYRTPTNGAAVFAIHFTADAAKRDPGWEATERMLYPDQSDFESEYNIDFDADSGQKIYHKFDPRWNIVPAYELPSDWIITLGVDPGATTAVTFLAQSPQTYECVVFDEVYVEGAGVDEICRMVYEKIAAAKGLDDIRGLDIADIVEDAVGDPSVPTLLNEYGMSSFPVIIRTKGFKTNWRLNDHKSGEAKMNQALQNSFPCCGVRWYPHGAREGYCGNCKEKREARPLLTYMDGKCPNHIRTIPALMRAGRSPGDIEAPDKEAKGQEDHAGDANRYVLMRTLFEIPREAVKRDYANAPSHGLEPHELLQKYRERAALMQQEQRERESDPDAIVVGSLIDEYDEWGEMSPDALFVN